MDSPVESSGQSIPIQVVIDMLNETSPRIWGPVSLREAVAIADEVGVRFLVAYSRTPPIRRKMWR